MKSKTSYFNKTIFVKNMFRFWPIWVLYLAILIFSMPVNLFVMTHPPITDPYKLQALSVALGWGLRTLPLCVFALLSAIAVFSYLYSARSCDTLHAMPLQRRELFITNYTSGILFLFIPQILTFLCMLIVCIIRNITNVEHLLFWLLCCMGISFFFYSLGVFCCMLSGNYVGSAALFLILLMLFRIIRSIVTNLLAALCFGYGELGSGILFDVSLSRWEFLSPFTFLRNFVYVQENVSDSGSLQSISLTGGVYVALYCIPAAVLLILSGILYKRRQLESAGDIIAVNWLAPVFRWLLSILGGLTCGMIFVNDIFLYAFRHYFLAFTVTAVIFSGIFYAIAEMLIQKKFQIFSRKGVFHWCICAGICVALLGCIKGDVFRIEEYMPKEEEIQAVEFSNEGVVTSDPEIIHKVYTVHQGILENKDLYQKFLKDHAVDTTDGSDDSLTDPTASLSLVYYLKDGGQVSRSYAIPVSKEFYDDPDSAVSQINSILSDGDLYLKSIIGSNYTEATVTGGTFTSIDPADASDHYTDLDADTASAIFEAYEKDVKAGHIGIQIPPEGYEGPEDYYNSLSILFYCSDGIQSSFSSGSFSTSIEEENGRFLSQSNARSQTTDAVSTTEEIYLNFTEDCTYTVQALKDQGLLDEHSVLMTTSDYVDWYE